MQPRANHDGLEVIPDMHEFLCCRVRYFKIQLNVPKADLTKDKDIPQSLFLPLTPTRTR